MKQKNTSVIQGLATVNQLTVQKSKPLFALWQSDLTLTEFKILDTYLGRIDSHDDTHRTVIFKKGELESLLGIKQIKPQVLDDRIKHLMTTVRIPDEHSKKGFTRISLFEKAHLEQDDYGLWEAELTCTESAKRYIFNIEELKYLRYKLKNIINIKSRYTYILFLYLWENKYRISWEISLGELKAMLNCENEETYKQFKRFNDLILKKIQKEIHEVTDITYDYETVKRGRSVVAIKFIYKSKFNELDDNQITIDQWQESVADDRPLWQAPLVDFGLNQLQIDEIRTILPTIPNHKFSQKEESWYDDSNRSDFQRFDYINQKIAEIKRRDAEKPIKNKFAYLLKMIKQDAVITEI